MNIHIIDAGNFKLDGGAMFGVVPKTLWSKKVPADELNLCAWKMRCLLVEIADRRILIDTGMGDKQAPKWQSYYYRHGDGDLIGAIQKLGLAAEDITDVILSHLHFDHAGGAVSQNEKGLYCTFPRAKYWTHSAHWQWAVEPNARESATFLKENLWPIHESEQLYFIDKENDLPKEIELLYANGHTEKMIMPLLHHPKQKILFAADTVPSFAHLHIPWVMGYDVRPLETMQEKSEILHRCEKENWALLFDHDATHECAFIAQNEKGFYPSDLLKLSEII
ncbi:MBL fold metallo-hydrolase [Marinilongibacter aquaticus]|uniref:MBL fold metallo-hydrolase n=1 Tax=Marinilongibacter aquaticus TaxID=2975157 RepID=UPI0021BDBF46|nr:MBL fold metallo-hydrolase [Marinilongibacter aquaticus]UBM59652.1 MBL fold metallo-hydrolase [Marinilongibacter aquaticus]